MSFLGIFGLRKFKVMQLRKNTFDKISKGLATLVQFAKCPLSRKPDVFRKPDMCPVSEEKCRKPVLVGLRSNNEMNIFGFRRCYGKKNKNVNNCSKGILIIKLRGEVQKKD